jgi:hypothetical protein
LRVEVHWGKPIPLRSGRKYNLIYTVDDLESLPTNAGVYVFGRFNGDRMVPMYVGQAKNLQSRINQQFNNARLMLGIEGSPGRRRVVVHGELIGKPGQQLTTTLNLVEKALIESAILSGHELINQQGTKPKFDSIRFSGSRQARSWHQRELSFHRQRRRKK